MWQAMAPMALSRLSALDMRSGMLAVLGGSAAFQHSQVKLLVPSGSAGAVIGDRRGERLSGFLSGPARAWPEQKSRISSIDMSLPLEHWRCIKSRLLELQIILGVCGTFAPAPLVLALLVLAPFGSYQEVGTPHQVLRVLEAPQQDVQ
jgi:hypothetical protein